MTYKTMVVDYAPKARKLAAAIEKAANEYAQSGWELVTFSVTSSAKAILVFRVPENVRQEGGVPEETAQTATPEGETFETVGDAE